MAFAQEALIVISESQARVLLYACERSLQRPLDRLRDQLGKSDDTLAALWELVVLHSAIQHGPGIDHEPSDGCPDILFRLHGIEQFAMDAKHIRWPDREEREHRHQFIEWIRQQVHVRCGTDPTSIHIQLDPTDRTDNAHILTHSHEWHDVFRSEAWQRILDAAKRPPPQRAIVDLEPPFRARLELTFSTSASRGFRCGYAAPQTIVRVSDHPVYAALEQKATQARKTWKLEEPLVICVGSSLTTSLWPMAESHPGADAAVVAALTDTSRWSIAQRHNLFRDTSDSDYRVRGADRISAVILVSIESPIQLGWRPSNHNRIAKARLYRNPNPRFPLSPAQEDLLQRIHFNHVAYGPQWETWRAPSASEWKNPDRITRRREPGKTMTYAPRSDGTFDFLLAAEDLVKLLMGKGSETEVLEAIDGLPVGRALSTKPRLTGVALVPGDAKTREPDRIKLTFDPFQQALVQGVKVPKVPKAQARPQAGAHPPDVVPHQLPERSEEHSDE